MSFITTREEKEAMNLKDIKNDIYRRACKEKK